MANVRGIDVSRYQGGIDWQKVKSDGIQFAMLRCGTGYNGGTKDSRFEQNYTNAKTVGLPIGAYYYTYAKTPEQAEKDAHLVLEWIKGKVFEYPVVFDIEDKTQKNLGKATISAIIKVFCNILEKAGYYVSVYANKDWLENRIDNECKTKYDIWLAQWSAKPTYNGNFGMWQYTSSGKVNGISGNVDMNIAYKNYPAIIKSNGLNGYKKTTTEKPKTEKPKENKKPVAKVYKKGDEITLKNASLYSSASDVMPKTKKTGKFYIYDGVEISGKYRITNKKTNCGKKPMWLYVTGWIKK